MGFAAERRDDLHGVLSSIEAQQQVKAREAAFDIAARASGPSDSSAGSEALPWQHLHSTSPESVTPTARRVCAHPAPSTSACSATTQRGTCLLSGSISSARVPSPLCDPVARVGWRRASRGRAGGGCTARTTTISTARGHRGAGTLSSSTLAAGSRRLSRCPWGSSAPERCPLTLSVR